VRVALDLVEGDGAPGTALDADLPARLAPPGGLMTDTELLALLQSAVATVLEVEPAAVTRGSRFVDDLRADSLALVEIVEIVEADLARAHPGFRIPDEDLDALLTVGDAVDYALARLV
jgi:acyl carrier protein